MVTISLHDIENLVNKIETGTPDLTPEIRPGDWVKLNCNSERCGYNDFHVEHVDGDKIYGGFGSREASKWTWLRMDRGPQNKRNVVQVWRQIDSVTRTAFQFNGQECHATEIGYTWKQIS